MEHLCSFKFEGWDDVDQEIIDLIRPHVRAVPDAARADGTRNHNYSYIYIGDAFKVQALLRGKRTVVLQDTELTVSAWEVVLQKLKALEERLVSPPSPQFNERIQVSIPGLGLLAINQVEVRLDYCTEELQRDLDNGWKILAICPQEQRRPDYVLGRTV